MIKITGFWSLIQFSQLTVLYSADTLVCITEIFQAFRVWLGTGTGQILESLWSELGQAELQKTVNQANIHFGLHKWHSISCFMYIEQQNTRETFLCLYHLTGNDFYFSSSSVFTKFSICSHQPLKSSLILCIRSDFFKSFILHTDICK